MSMFEHSFTGAVPVIAATVPQPFAATIRLPLSKNPLSLNGRMNLYAKARLVKQWRTFAGLSAKRFPALGQCDVTLTWFVTDRRRRDEDNLYLLLKALCDGLVDAGVVVDDTGDLMGKRCRIARAPEGTSTAYMELLIETRTNPKESI